MRSRITRFTRSISSCCSSVKPKSMAVKKAKKIGNGRNRSLFLVIRKSRCSFELLPIPESILIDHPLLLRCEIDSFVIDVLVLGGDTQDFEWLFRRAFKPVFIAARYQNSFAFLVFPDQLVAFAVKLDCAFDDVPKGVLAGVRMEVVLAAVLHYLHLDFHEVAV